MSNVQLIQQSCRRLAQMQFYGQLLDQHEIVMDTSTADEGTLIVVDKIIKLARQPPGQHLREELGKTVQKANWPVILQVARINLLGEKSDEGRVHFIKTRPIHPVKLVKCCHDIYLNDFPARFVEQSCEAIRTRSFSTTNRYDRALSKVGLQPSCFPKEVQNGFDHISLSEHWSEEHCIISI